MGTAIQRTPGRKHPRAEKQVRKSLGDSEDLGQGLADLSAEDRPDRCRDTCLEAVQAGYTEGCSGVALWSGGGGMSLEVSLLGVD